MPDIYGSEAPCGGVALLAPHSIPLETLWLTAKAGTRFVPALPEPLCLGGRGFVASAWHMVPVGNVQQNYCWVYIGRGLGNRTKSGSAQWLGSMWRAEGAHTHGGHRLGSCYCCGELLVQIIKSCRIAVCFSRAQSAFFNFVMPLLQAELLRRWFFLF